MNRPQLTSLHYSTVHMNTDIQTLSLFAPDKTTKLFFLSMKNKWYSLTPYQQTSLLLNMSAVFGIVAFVCYLLSKSNSRKINKKKIIT